MGRSSHWQRSNWRNSLMHNWLKRLAKSLSRISYTRERDETFFLFFVSTRRAGGGTRGRVDKSRHRIAGGGMGWKGERRDSEGGGGLGLAGSGGGERKKIAAPLTSGAAWGLYFDAGGWVGNDEAQDPPGGTPVQWSRARTTVGLPGRRCRWRKCPPNRGARTGGSDWHRLAVLALGSEVPVFGDRPCQGTRQ